MPGERVATRLPTPTPAVAMQSLTATGGGACPAAGQHRHARRHAAHTTPVALLQHARGQLLAARRERQRPRQRRRDTAAHVALDSCTLIAVASNVGVSGSGGELGGLMTSLVQQQLTGVTPGSCGAVLLAGLATSLSPCTLSVLPLTIGYIGGYTGGEGPAHSGGSSSSTSSSSSSGGGAGGVCCQQPDTPAAGQPAQQQQAQQQQAQQQQAQQQASGVLTATVAAHAAASSQQQQAAAPPAAGSSRLWLQALCFSLGLASSLAALGVASSSLGGAYGAVWPGLPLGVACVAIAMGLNLLQVITLPLPSLLADADVGAAAARLRLPPPLMAYATGAVFALAASPCATPVLAAILAFAATQDSPGAGGLLLFLYSCGYVVPLLAAATATGAAKRVLALRAYAAWVTPASGVLLVGGGTYALLARLLPDL